MNTEYNLMYLMALILMIGITLNIWQSLEEDDYTPKE